MFQRSKLPLAVALTIAGLTSPLTAAETDYQNDTTELEALDVVATRGATKTETPYVETPQAISVIDREEWEEKGAKSVQRAANYTPGVSTNQVGASNRYDYLILRGFSDGSINNTYLDGLKVMSDAGSFSSFTIDPWFLERIEIVKGPTSVLYGQGSPGGLVALTSKKPEFQQGGEVRVTAGNNAQRSLAFDLTGPLDEEKRVAYRLTGITSASDTQFDHVEEERHAIAPSLTWDMTDDTSLTLLAYLQKDPEGGYHSGLPYEGTVESRNGQKIDNTFFEGEPDYDKFKRDMYMVGYELDHRFNNTWSARQNLRYLESDVELKQVYAFGWATDTELMRFFSGADEDLEALTVDNQLQADFFTGAVDHTVLVGLDYQQRENDVVWPSGAFPNIDAFNPVYGAEPTALYPPVRNLREQKQTGVYLQDQLAMGGWRLTLGGRHDWVEIDNTNRDSGVVTTLDDTQFSGRAGLLYLFDNGIAPYVSYSTSFSPSAFTDENGDLLDPSEGQQIETGLKYQPAGTRDQYTASLFRIKQENLATKLPQETFYRGIGEIQSQGVELEAKAQITNNLNVQAGYAYTDVTFEKSEAYRQGNTASQVPEHQLTLWTGYRFNDGVLNGANAGLGIRYAADIYADDANTKKVPDYTLVDLALGYDLGKVGLKGVSTQLNVHNLLDKEYVASCYNSLEFCYFGAERNITASVSYRF
ncbi:TonB-dependent siderophore receptor [Marinobacter sp. NP-4(2019)]|uniref:TonB-dependent siderophore receptor n=1 Tax=Marinobacter sp. NP-4(2019) TaxID=2488665 RepID=UPI000FC3CB5C|nr:TonB-dependent siderophore receptor [Marinobacter sp. NP-4(2019)]AZT85685.1 TonB-dependent siderophore receptor [Marinobacter sp. NP-4(2019)]